MLISNVKHCAQNVNVRDHIVDGTEGVLPGVRGSFKERAPGTFPEVVMQGVGILIRSDVRWYVVGGSPVENFNARTVNSVDYVSLAVLKDVSVTASCEVRAAECFFCASSQKRGLKERVDNF